MSFFQRIIAEWSGLNKIGHTLESNALPQALDACYGLKPTDHRSKGQVVVAARHTGATDHLSSDQLHERARQALREMRELAR